MNAQSVSLAVLLALLVVLGILFFQILAPFILPLFLAIMLTIVCQPLFERMLLRVRGNRTWAAGLTTVLVLLAGVIPLAFGTLFAALELAILANDDRWLATADSSAKACWNHQLLPLLTQLRPFFPGLPAPEALPEVLTQGAREFSGLLVKQSITLGQATLGTMISVVVGLGVMLTAFFYFLADGPEMLATAERLIPVPIEHQRRLREEFTRSVQAVVLSTFAAAIAQGLATALALQFVGIGWFFVMCALATVASLLPVAGAWLVWGPAAVWLVSQGNWGYAIVLVIWGIVVVSSLDNYVRMLVLQSSAKLHPLLAFISIVGALQAMGLWGIFLGPVLASCLSALLGVFHSELRPYLAAEPPITPPVTVPVSHSATAQPSPPVDAAPVHAAPALATPEASCPLP